MRMMLAFVLPFPVPTQVRRERVQQRLRRGLTRARDQLRSEHGWDGVEFGDAF